jgi:hypothetical protein
VSFVPEHIMLAGFVATMVLMVVRAWLGDL